MIKKRKKRNLSKLIIYALFLGILTCLAISGTFAKYISAEFGIGMAEVAKWSFKVNNIAEPSLTRTNFTESIADGLLAPGTEGYFAVEVDAYGAEVAIDYEIEILNIKNKPQNLNFYTNSTYTTKVIGVEKEVENEEGILETQTTYTVTGHMTLQEVLNESTAKKTVRMYWQWPFESEAENGDTIDTEDGFNEDMECTIRVVGIQSIGEKGEGTYYTIDYDLNGAMGIEIPYQNKEEGVDIRVTSLIPSRTGYEFLGWSTTKNATTAEYNAGDIFAEDKNTTLYAVWKANTYTVTYDYATNGGTSASVTTAKVKYGEEIDLSVTATKLGYTFVGWNTSSSAITEIDGLKMPLDGVTLYAIYSKEITVTYNYYDGIQASTDIKTIYNTTTTARFTIPTNTVTRANYVFKGWNSDPSGTGTPYTEETGYDFAESTQIYAIWEEAVATTETTGYASLAKAMDWATSGQTVTMLKNSTETETATVASGKELTLNLNGKTVTYSEKTAIKSEGILTVVGSGNITGSATNTIQNSGELKINDTSEIKINNTTGRGIYNESVGIVNISNPNLTIESYSNTIANVNEGIINIEAGTYISTASDKCGLGNGSNSDINIYGNLPINIVSNQIGIYNESVGKVNISNPNLTIEAYSNTIANVNNGIVNIEAGTYISTANNKCGFGNTGDGTINVQGNSTINITSNQIGIYNSASGIVNVVNQNTIIKARTYGIFNVKNGVISMLAGSIQESYAGVYNESTGTITIGADDGTVSTTSPSITGSTYGIQMKSGTLNFYDGVIKGATAINGTVTTKPTGYIVKKTTENGIETAILSLN